MFDRKPSQQRCCCKTMKSACPFVHSGWGNFSSKYRVFGESVSGRLNNRHGFILMEIMVSISIIAIVFVSMFRMQSNTIELASRGKFKAIAPFIAQMKLSQIIQEIHNDGDLTEYSQAFSQVYKGYSWKCEISELPADELTDFDDKHSQNLKQINLTIFSIEDDLRYTLKTWRYFTLNDSHE